MMGLQSLFVWAGFIVGVMYTYGLVNCLSPSIQFSMKIEKALCSCFKSASTFVTVEESFGVVGGPNEGGAGMAGGLPMFIRNN